MIVPRFSFAPLVVEASSRVRHFSRFSRSGLAAQHVGARLARFSFVYLGALGGGSSSSHHSK
jgi:hypothetical protein